MILFAMMFLVVFIVFGMKLLLLMWRLRMASLFFLVGMLIFMMDIVMLILNRSVELMGVIAQMMERIELLTHRCMAHLVRRIDLVLFVMMSTIFLLILYLLLTHNKNIMLHFFIA